MSQQSAPSQMDTMLYLRHLNPFLSSGSNIRRVQAKLPWLDCDTDTAQLTLKLLLRGLDGLVADESHWPLVYPVGRIEIFGDWHSSSGPNSDRGLVLFDTKGQPLIHVVNALIGYDGSGPNLTKFIFDELGIDQVIFEQIQTAYADVVRYGTPYYVIVQSMRNDDGTTVWHWASANDPYN